MRSFGEVFRFGRSASPLRDRPRRLNDLPQAQRASTPPRSRRSMGCRYRPHGAGSVNHVVRWNVRNRFVVAFIIVAVVPLVVFGALVYLRTARTLHEVEQDRITAQATGARQVLRQRVADERTYIRDYSVWDEFHAAVRERHLLWIRNNVTDWVPANSSNNMVHDLRAHRRRARARRRPRVHPALGQRPRAVGAPRRDRLRPRGAGRQALRAGGRADHRADVPVATGRHTRLRPGGHGRRARQRQSIHRRPGAALRVHRQRRVGGDRSRRERRGRASALGVLRARPGVPRR